MQNHTIGRWPLFMMIALSAGLSAHVNLLPILLEICGRDAWLCSFGAFALVMPWMLIVVVGIMKRTGQAHFRKWLIARISAPGAWLLLGPVVLLLGISSLQTFCETIAWTSATYLPETPKSVLIFCFMCLVGFGVWHGVRAVAYMSCILFPIVVVLGDFVMTANMPHKDYSYLLPVMANGWLPLLQGIAFASGGLLEVSVVLFIQHRLSFKATRTSFAVLLSFLSLLMLGPAIGAITEFGPAEAAKMSFPAFAQWRIVTIGKYIEHLDFFAIYQWMSGAFVRAALGLIIVMEILPIRQGRPRLVTVLAISLLFSAMAYMLINITMQVRSILHVIYIADICVIVVVTAVAWLFSFGKGRNSNGRSGNDDERREVPGSSAV